MKRHYITFIVLNLLLNSCGNENNKSNECINSDSISIREIPMIIESFEKREKNLFFAVKSCNEMASSIMIDSIDNFVCSNILDTIDIENYSSFIITFLKETQETKLINGKGITDSNNPRSSKHFIYIDYLWQKGLFYEKRLNDWDEIIDNFKCADDV